MSGTHLRIAMLTHSTNPRGGVVHALDVADALTISGHEAVVHAPDSSGNGFFRTPLTPAVTILATPAGRDVAGMVRARIDDYIRHFESATAREFDVFHAQDSISGNALADLKARGLIKGFFRTVHHIDQFADPQLDRWQKRAIVEADELFVVSRMWQDVLQERFDRNSTVIGNGVDTSRFTPGRSTADAVIAARYGIGGDPIFLSVGGVEERKNSVGILRAFEQLLAVYPDAKLIIAGGASLLDHTEYQRSFQDHVRTNPALTRGVLRTGPVQDSDMPSLYRLADALVFPSLKEGFGLSVLEAMASGTPVVTSRIAPFTEYLGDDDVIWCNPLNVASIANAMMTVVSDPIGAHLRRQGLLIARQHNWSRVAASHLPVYRKLVDRQYA